MESTQVISHFDWYDGPLNGFAVAGDAWCYFEAVWCGPALLERVFRAHWLHEGAVARLDDLTHVVAMRAAMRDDDENSAPSFVDVKGTRGAFFRAGKRFKKRSSRVTYTFGRSFERSVSVSDLDGFARPGAAPLKP